MEILESQNKEHGFYGTAALHGRREINAKWETAFAWVASVMPSWSPENIRDFLDDGRLDDVIRMAIDQHNVYQLREDLTPRQRLFCQLIRDADKIDIFRVYVLYMSQKKNIWNVDWADFENQPISDSVMAQARQGKLVRTQDKKTFMDFYVGALCLYFDLVYPRSRQLAREQGYFDKLLDFHSRNVDSEKKLDEIRCLVRKAETLPQTQFVGTMYNDT